MLKHLFYVLTNLRVRLRFTCHVGIQGSVGPVLPAMSLGIQRPDVVVVSTYSDPHAVANQHTLIFTLKKQARSCEKLRRQFDFSSAKDRLSLGF